MASTPGGAALAPGALRGKSRLKTRSFHPHVCLEWPGSTQSLWLNFPAGKTYYSYFILSCYDGTGVRTGAHTHTDGLRVWEGFGASRPPSSHIRSPGSALSPAPCRSSVGLWRLGKWMRSGPGAGRWKVFTWAGNGNGCAAWPCAVLSSACRGAGARGPSVTPAATGGKHLVPARGIRPNTRPFSLGQSSAAHGESVYQGHPAEGSLCLRSTWSCVALLGMTPPSPPSVSSPPPLPSGKPVASRESEYLRSGRERGRSATSDVPRPQLTALCLGPAAVPGRPPSTEGLARGRLHPRASRACVHGDWEFRRQPVLPGAPALDRQLPGFQGTASPACVSLATGKTAAVSEVACPARASRVRPGGQAQGERSWRGPALQPAPRLRPAHLPQRSLRLLRACVLAPTGCALFSIPPLVLGLNHGAWCGKAAAPCRERCPDRCSPHPLHPETRRVPCTEPRGAASGCGRSL